MVGSDENTAGWPGCGEIDTLEALGQQPQSLQQYAHWGAPTSFSGQGWSLPKGESIAGWHVYSVVWGPTEIQWQVDGVTTMSLTSAEVGQDWAADFEHPFALRLDLQVGGWAGAPTPATKFPATMLLDWIRVTTADVPVP
jgi:beta-glucanase (GH16 family)